MKKVISRIVDAALLYLPMVAFIIVFVTYLVMIFYRYIFHAAMAELYELNMIAFLWCATIAAAYATRKDLHIRFEVLYEKLNEKKRLIMRLVGNLIVLVLFSILLPHAYNAVIFQGIRKTSILGISFTIVYFPFIILNVVTIIEYFISVIRDIKLGVSMLKGKEKE